MDAVWSFFAQKQERTIEDEMENKLMEVRYQDSAQSIMLTGYADTVIADPEYRLVGIRVGGYPEMVQGISAAICGGATVTITAEKQTYVLTAESGCYCKNRHPSPICTQFEHHFHALKPHLLYHSF